MPRAKYNFSAGPAVLPDEVLLEASRGVVEISNSGMSILCVSHRGGAYEALHQEATANLRELLAIPEEFAVLLLQGGASTQFALVPMNLAQGKPVDYALSGQWAQAALVEAEKVAKPRVVADSGKVRPARMPFPGEMKLSSDAAYVHLTSNETIDGTRWVEFPQSPVPLVADMSSDIMSRPIPWSQFGLVYAGAQKNLGPAGVTVVVIRKDLAAQAPASLPTMLRYQTHVEKESLYNTPPCFSIYVLALVTRWVKKMGGIAGVSALNESKAKKLYAAIDRTGFYRGTADKNFRSLMNVTFRLPTPELEEKFAKESSAIGLSGLKGHRSVGGIRASIYNAMPEAGVDALVSFMEDFEKRQG